MASLNSAAARARAAELPVPPAETQAAPGLLVRIVSFGPLDRPLSWLARQAVRVLPAREPISAAWLVVVCTFAWGFWVLLPGDTMTIPGYQLLDAATDEWVWGLLAMGLGSAGAFGLYSYPDRTPEMLRRRRVAMTVVGSWHVFVGISFLLSRPSSTGAPIYCLLGCWALIHAMWLRVAAGHASDATLGG